MRRWWMSWRSSRRRMPRNPIMRSSRPCVLEWRRSPNAVLLCASSPYARRGELWETHRKYFGRDGNILIWQAPTRVMNPTVPQTVIDAALERDMSSAQSEFLAQFRTDIEAYIDRDAVLACLDPNIRERAPRQGVTYSAFVDPAVWVGFHAVTTMHRFETG